MKRQKKINLFTQFYILEFCLILPILLFSILFLFWFFSRDSSLSSSTSQFTLKITKEDSQKDLYLNMKQKHFVLESPNSYFNITLNNNKTVINEIATNCKGQIIDTNKTIFFTADKCLLQFIPKVFFLNNVTIKEPELNSFFYADTLLLDMNNDYDIKAQKIRLHTL